MSASSRMAIKAFFSSANSFGVAVQDSRSQGMLSAMSRFRAEGSPPLIPSEQFSPVLALVASQPWKPCWSQQRSTLALLIFIPPTSTWEKMRRRSCLLPSLALGPGSPCRDDVPSHPDWLAPGWFRAVSRAFSQSPASAKGSSFWGLMSKRARAVSPRNRRWMRR